jgi:demethylmenaquinone methyltransferase/2-methoxy-6-polyprenyl-1,4-benzoquinol methylase
LPRGDEKALAVRAMFDAIAPRYELMNRLISLGLDRTWRRRAVAALELAPSSIVVDLACGTGDLCRELTRTGQRALGVDFSRKMLAAATRGAVPLVQADAAMLPMATGTTDGLVCGFALRNFADLAAVLTEIGRVVRPGGRISLLEVDEPRARLLAIGHRIWFRGVVPVLGALLSDKAAYRYLPRSVAYLPRPTEMAALVAEAGFVEVRRLALHGGIAQIIVATRAGARRLTVGPGTAPPERGRA